MRNCIRCNTPMVENLQLRDNNAVGLTVGEKGFFKGSLGKVTCAVCPKCGYLESYLADTEKIQELQNKA